MGERNRDRQLAEARSAYMGAFAQLRRATDAFNRLAVPLEPGRGPEPEPWTREHVQAVVAMANTWHDLVERRREWDALRREWHSPH